jgi:hypothetical protein
VGQFGPHVDGLASARFCLRLHYLWQFGPHVNQATRDETVPFIPEFCIEDLRRCQSIVLTLPLKDNAFLERRREFNG